MNIGINIILDGAPDHESGRFVEVENDDGQSISIGDWTEREDGYWGLRIEMDSERLRSETKELEAQLAKEIDFHREILLNHITELEAENKALREQVGGLRATRTHLQNDVKELEAQLETLRKLIRPHPPDWDCKASTGE